MTSEDRCSFCGKRRDQVRQLVAGQKIAEHHVFICNECVSLIATPVVEEHVDIGEFARRWPPLKIPRRDD